MDPLLLNDEVLELRDIVFVELMRDIVPSSARRALRKLPSTRTCMTVKPQAVAMLIFMLRKFLQ